MTNNVGVPNAQTSAKDESGKATFDVSAMMIGTNDPIYVGETIKIVYNGRTYNVTFKGWNTQADMRGKYYYPKGDSATGDQSITISDDTTLYAVWTAEGYGELRINKTIAGENLTDEQLEEEFTFRISLSDVTLEDSYAYGVYNADSSRDHYGTWSNNDTIVLKHGQYAIIEGLPADAVVAVQEVDIPSDYGTPEWAYSKVQDNQSTTITGENLTIVGAARVVASCTNKLAPKTSVTVTKVWDDNNNQGGLRPESVTVNLLDSSDVIDSVVLSGSKLSHTFEGLDANGTYTVEEVGVPQYYTASVSSNIENGFTITNTLETVQITVNKVWKDGSGNPDTSHDFNEIEFHLYANGVQYAINNTTHLKLTSANDWTDTFTVPKQLNGQDITWKVVEHGTYGKYVPSYSYGENQTSIQFTNSMGSATITNTFNSEKKSLVVVKEWIGDEDRENLCPDSITVALYQSNSKDGPWTRFGEVKTLTAANGWRDRWTNLPIEVSPETPYHYQVAEVELGSDGDVTIIQNGTVEGKDGATYEPDYNAGQDITIQGSVVAPVFITNTLNTTTINVEKKWVGEVPNGSVTINVMKGNDVAGTITLNVENGWEGSITLPTLPEGQTYTVVEAGVDTNSKVTIDGRKYEVKVTPPTGTNDKWTITNTELRDITVTKVWADSGFEYLRPDSITVKLLKDGADTQERLILNQDNNWSDTFQNLITADDSGKIVYTVQEDGAEDGVINFGKVSYAVSVNDFTITNTIQKETATVDIHITKAWLDEGHENERPVITALFEVYRVVNENEELVNASDYSYIVMDADADDNGIVDAKEDHVRYHRITGLPKYDSTGNVIKYTIKEKMSQIEDMYRSDVQQIENGSYMSDYDYVYVATNTLRNYLVIEKTWDDNNNQDRLRPDTVTLTLLADGKDVGSYTLSSNDDWKTVLKDMPFSKIGEDGHVSAIEYSIREENIPNGYSVAYTSDTTNITIGSETITGVKRLTATNTHTPETVNISVEKVWNSVNDGTHPDSITVQLYSSVGNVTATPVDSKTLTLTVENDWKGSFDGLAKYKNGQEITYSVKEAEIAGYTGNYATVNGNIIITNTQNTASIRVNKVWDDNNNQDGKRPTAITVNLFANGELFASRLVQSDENGEWKTTFEGLPMYTYNGATSTAIAYTVTEDTVTDYTTVYDYGGNNTAVVFQSVTEGDGESAVSKMVGAATITNSYTPETTSVSVTKVWKDAGNQDGKRPGSITVNLLANGVKVDGKSLTLPIENTWTGSFSNLPKYKDGKEIAYTVEEQGVTNGKVTFDETEYNVSIAGSAITGYTITNTHTPETVNISCKKVWNDSNNQDGVRPDSIWVRVVGKVGDEVVESATQTKEIHPDGADPTTPESQANTPSAQAVIDNEWNFVFTDLPKYHNGTEIQYSVEELQSENGDAIDRDKTLTVANGKTYTVSYGANNTITNSYTPATTSVQVEKVWNMQNSNISAPSYARVQLVKNGVDYLPEGIGCKIMGSGLNNATGSFIYAWENLPKYENGQEIIWTVREIFDDIADTITIPQATDPNNTVKIPIRNAFAISQVKDGNKTTITNTFDLTHRSAIVEKIWDDGGNAEGLRPSQIQVQLWQGTPNDADNDNTIVEGEVSWKKVADELVKTHSDEHVTITVDGDQIDGIVELNANNSWQYIWTMLPQYSNATNRTGAYWYKVTEITSESDDWSQYYNDPNDQYTDEIPTDERGSVTPAAENVFAWEIKNVRKAEEVNITANKIWDDKSNQDGKRPNEAIFNLIGKVGDTVVYTVHHHIKPSETGVTVSDNGNQWSYTFANLPRYALGQQIQYTVQEVDAEGNAIDNNNNKLNGVYTVTYGTMNNNTVIVTNTHTPATVTISGTKTWNMNNSGLTAPTEKPTIQLFADGTCVTDSNNKAVTPTWNGWDYTFGAQPKYSSGKEIVYTVVEEPVNGYTSTVNGYDITNTLETTDITVTKIWSDNNDQDGVRPESITVKVSGVYSDDKTIDKTYTIKPGETGVTAGDNTWQYTFKNLPTKKATGQPINYAVAETGVIPKTGMHATIDKGKMTITKENSEGAADNENFEYIVTVEGSTSTGYIITNSHTPETATLQLTKIWEDNNNQDGKRPDSITIGIKEGNDIIVYRTLSEGAAYIEENGNKWTWTVTTELPKYRNGALIEYSIVETPIEGYQPTIVGSTTYGTVPNYSTSDIDDNILAASVTVTNTHIPETISISGTKVWYDENDRFGIRPNSITLQLYADDEQTAVATSTATASNNWSYTFANLPRYKAGQEIIYTVKEQAVLGYSSNADEGLVVSTNEANRIINTLDRISISVTKAWDESAAKYEDQDSQRPESIDVKLMNGETVVARRTLDKESDWKYTFTNLPKYEKKADGTIAEITYTVVEEAVDGYEASYVMLLTTEGEIRIINTLTENHITIEKKWNGPVGANSVEVDVVFEGYVIETIELTAADNWKYEYTWYGTMDGLTFKEVNVPTNYISSGGDVIEKVDGDDTYAVTITNTYDLPYTPDGGDDDNDYDHDDGEKVIVKKVWVGGDGDYPDVEIQLYKNGRKYRDPATLKDSKITSKNWRYVWEDVSEDEYTVWSVRELNVPAGYRSDVTQVRSNYFIVTNTWVEEKPNPGTGAN